MKTEIVYTAETPGEEKALASLWNHAPEGQYVVLEKESERGRRMREGVFRSHVKQIRVSYE